MKYELPLLRLNEIIESLSNPVLSSTQKDYADLVREAGQIIKDHRLGTQSDSYGDYLIAQSECMLQKSTPHEAYEIAIHSRLGLDTYLSLL